MNRRCLYSLAVIDKYSMDKLDIIAKDLFDKIRGRYQNVTLGNQESTITNEPGQARFFDVKITNGQNVNLALDEKSLTIMYSQKLFDEDHIGKDNWYSFLKELRMFAKKRMLNFDIRDITKSNLDRRDYEYLRKEKFGDTTMSESKLYGTSKKSFQDIGSSKLIITHTESMNYETNRSTKIKSIHIENADGERFKYPYKHLSGARAIARHVSEGGNLYDDFGKHVIGLSEELSKLRKFKTYMNRSAVMAEGLGGYADAVNERLDTIKTTIHKLQKESFYREYYEAFSPEDDVVVPEDIQGDWIEQLTVKQFNEELKDVFPYIYKLVSENSKTKELSLEELTDATKGENMNPDFDEMFDESLGRFASNTKIATVQDFLEYMMENITTKEQLLNLNESIIDNYANHLNESRGVILENNGKGILKSVLGGVSKTVKSFIKGGGDESVGKKAAEAAGATPQKQKEALEKIAEIGKKEAEKVNKAAGIDTTKAPVNSLVDAAPKSFVAGAKDKAGAAVKKATDAVKGADPGVKTGVALGATSTAGTLAVTDIYHDKAKEVANANTAAVVDAVQNATGAVSDSMDAIVVDTEAQKNELIAKGDEILQKGDELKAQGDDMMKKASDMATGAVETVTSGELGSKLKQALPQVSGGGLSQILSIAAANWLPIGMVLLAVLGGFKVLGWIFRLLFSSTEHTGNALSESGDAKVPVTEFILSYFDRETGSFPKGETAVLTMVEKDYGDKYVPVAEKFIEAVQHKFVEMNQGSNELDRIRELAKI